MDMGALYQDSRDSDFWSAEKIGIDLERPTHRSSSGNFFRDEMAVAAS
jgi:hypothetical protein